MQKKYLLRWRFEYATRPAKAGLWLHTGTSDVDKAAFQTKEGLLYAVIEGKDVLTRETVTLARVPGEDFMNFQWVANAIMRPFAGGSQTPYTYLSGLKILTRYEQIEVDVTGKITRHPPTHLNINFASFGR